MTVLFTGFWFSRTTSLFPESARQIWCDFSDCCILLSQQHSCLSFSPLTPVSPDHCSYRVVIKWAVHGSYWKPSLFQNLPFRPRLPVAHSPLPTGWKWKTWKLRDFLKQLGTANVTQTGVNFICRLQQRQRVDVIVGKLLWPCEQVLDDTKPILDNHWPDSMQDSVLN